MVSARLALTLTLVSFLCAAPANDLTIKAKEIVTQDGKDNNIIIKKNVLDVKEDDKTIVKEEEPVLHHDLLIEDIPRHIVEDEIHDAIGREFDHNVDNITVVNDEVIERNTVVEEKEVVEVEAPEPHDGPFFRIPFDIEF